MSMLEIHSPPDLITSLDAIGDLHEPFGIDGGDISGVEEPVFVEELAVSSLK